MDFLRHVITHMYEHTRWGKGGGTPYSGFLGNYGLITEYSVVHMEYDYSVELVVAWYPICQRGAHHKEAYQSIAGHCSFLVRISERSSGTAYTMPKPPHPTTRARNTDDRTMDPNSRIQSCMLYTSYYSVVRSRIYAR